MAKVKVCGLGSPEQADWAIELGYDAIGIVVSPRSKRYCPPDRARAIARHARGRIETFAVAYTLDEVGVLQHDFDIVQLYAPAPISNLAYASSEPPPSGLVCQYYFYDASIGSGIFRSIPDWVSEVRYPLYIAGGLTEENVSEIIDRFNPFGVDVSSAVEIAPRVKCKTKMERFLSATRSRSSDRN